MTHRLKRFFLLLPFIALMLLYALDLHHFISLGALQNYQAELALFHITHPIMTPFLFFLLCTLSLTLILPGTLIFMLAGGAVFGPLFGGTLVLISITLGASAAFLATRFFMRDYIENKFEKWITHANSGLTDYGLNYIFISRLLPVPFFIMNPVFGVTRVSLKHFLVGTFFGMMPTAFIYASAGSTLFKITSLKDIVTTEIFILFFLLFCLAVLPLLIKHFKKT